MLNHCFFSAKHLSWAQTGGVLPIVCWGRRRMSHLRLQKLHRPAQTQKVGRGALHHFFITIIFIFRVTLWKTDVVKSLANWLNFSNTLLKWLWQARIRISTEEFIGVTLASEDTYWSNLKVIVAERSRWWVWWGDRQDGGMWSRSWTRR